MDSLSYQHVKTSMYSDFFFFLKQRLSLIKKETKCLQVRDHCYEGLAQYKRRTIIETHKVKIEAHLRVAGPTGEEETGRFRNDQIREGSEAIRWRRVAVDFTGEDLREPELNHLRGESRI